jgi:hypothetical protein
MNREQWLTDMALQVRPLFSAFRIDPYRVSCGWPSSKGLAGRGGVVGECTGKEASQGGVYEIFISPLLDKPLEVAGTLCHELAHVAAGVGAQHGKEFVRVCKYVGLTKGKPTHVMPGDRLNDRLSKLIDIQGAYPHQRIQPILRRVERTSTTARLLCTVCGCRLSMSFKWLESVGMPRCGCGGEITNISEE